MKSPAAILLSAALAGIASAAVTVDGVAVAAGASGEGWTYEEPVVRLTGPGPFAVSGTDYAGGAVLRAEADCTVVVSNLQLSAATTAGTRELMQRCAALLDTLPPITVYEPDYVPPEPDLGSAEELDIFEDDGVWYAEGPWMDRLVSAVNFSDYESRMFFDRKLRDNGVYERMESLGIKDGDTISICGMTFEYKS